MALKLVRTPKDSIPEKQTKTREEYYIACLREEANDSKFTDWERSFIISLARQMASKKQCSPKQKEILLRLWKK